jgi:hypothetical protein
MPGVQRSWNSITMTLGSCADSCRNKREYPCRGGFEDQMILTARATTMMITERETTD